ncbi:MAG: Methionyl-tRNA formyltransferase [Candidatus Poribacteria bacterium]|nr:Methionyl-tRNA formyltransferase [Candidatus Poribacteria bacterium]
MRVVFMGTDKFAVPALKSVIKSGVKLICVVTQPDQPKGRGLKLTPSPIKEVAIEYNIPIYQPERVRDKQFIEKIEQEFKPELIIVVAFGQIIPKAILELPEYRCINIHPSLLPKYRGAAPIQRAIINGENETGVTLMFVDEGEDTGDIIYQEHLSIGMSDSSEILSEKLAEISARMLLTLLTKEDGSPVELLMLPRYSQDHSKATQAPKLTKEDGLINWDKSAYEIHNLIRGTIPWPGAYTTFQLTGSNDMKTLRIWESLLPESSTEKKVKTEPGTITGITSDSGMVIETGMGELIINIVQPADKSKMKAKDFVNGYRLKIGDVLGIKS